MRGAHPSRPTELLRALSALELALKSEGSVLIAEARRSLAMRYTYHLHSGGLFAAEMFACSERLRYEAVIIEEREIAVHLWQED
jgi:hypothetical protein